MAMLSCSWASTWWFWSLAILLLAPGWYGLSSHVSGCFGWLVWMVGWFLWLILVFLSKNRDELCTVHCLCLVNVCLVDLCVISDGSTPFIPSAGSSLAVTHKSVQTWWLSHGLGLLLDAQQLCELCGALLKVEPMIGSGLVCSCLSWFWQSFGYWQLARTLGF
jgi:hypothetical protein